MKLQIRATAEGAELDIIQPGQGSGVEDKVLNTVPVAAGYQVDVNLPTATVIEQIECGEAVSSGGVDTPTEPPAPGGDAGGGEQPAPGDGDQGGGTAEPPTTSAASEKPLYLVEGDTIPEGFSESGLETPDGKTLFHFGSDTAGQHSTGNVDGVSIYAEADDNEKPVQAAVTS
jgi:hypothetical protein